MYFHPQKVLNLKTGLFSLLNRKKWLLSSGYLRWICFQSRAFYRQLLESRVFNLHPCYTAFETVSIWVRSQILQACERGFFSAPWQYFVSKIVMYTKIKNLLVKRNSRLKAKNLHNFLDHQNITFVYFFLKKNVSIGVVKKWDKSRDC